MTRIDDDMDSMGLGWDHDLTGTEQEYLEVSGMDDDMARNDSGELRIPDLRECVGIAVYDRSSGIGYAAHFKTDGKSADELTQDLRDFNSLLVRDDLDYDRSEVMVAGIDHSESIVDMFLGDNDEIEKIFEQGKRRSLVQEYAEQYFADSEVRWDVEEGHNSEIVLDIDEGVLEYDDSSSLK